MNNNKFLLLILCFFTHFAFCQQLPREVLKGQILDENEGLENIKVENISSGKYVISGANGFFELYVRAKDTLVFSSLSYASKKIILDQNDFKVKLFRIKLDSFVNTLDEVVIDPNALTGNLESDEKNIKIIAVPKIDLAAAIVSVFESDNYNTPDNKLMPGYLDTSYMTDLIAIGQKIGKLFKTKKPADQPKFISQKIFPVAVREKIPDSFFEKSLLLKPNEIGLFLTFCEADPDAEALLEPKREFELIDFLFTKKKEYAVFKKE